MTINACSNIPPSEPFITASLTRGIHDWNRFGGTNNLSEVIANNEDVKGYSMGIVVISIFIFSVFTTWSLVLLIMKCLGEKRVGFLSGSSFVISGSGKRCFTPKKSRIITIICGLAIIAFSISLAVQFDKAVVGTVSSLIDTTKYLNRVSNNLEFQARSLAIFTLRSDDIAENINGIINDGGVCPGQDILTLSGVSFNTIMSDTVESIEKVTVIIKDKVQTLVTVAENLSDKTNKANKEMEDVKGYGWVVLTWSLPMIFFTSVYLIGVLLAWKRISGRKIESMLSYVNMPGMVIFLILGWVLCGIFSIAAMVNSDACSGGNDQTPSGTVEVIMQSVEGSDDVKILTQDIVKYYVGGCQGCPFSFLEQVQSDIGNSTSISRSFVTSLNETGIDLVAAQCASKTANEIEATFDDFTKFTEDLESVQTDGMRTVETIIGLLGCESISAMWKDTVEKRGCETTVYTFNWGFWCWLVSSVLGYIMLTLRATYLNDEYGNMNSYVE